MREDALIVTAREMIAAAEQERDLAHGRAELLQGELDRAKDLMARMREEMRAIPRGDDQWYALASVIVDDVWRYCLEAKDYDQGGRYEDEFANVPDLAHFKGLLALRLERGRA